MKSCAVLLLLILAAAGNVSIAAAQSAGTFTATGNMTTARSSHAATLLQDGRVLIARGGSATVELYHLSTGTFAATGVMTASTNVGSATLLPAGRVLLIEAQEAQSVGAYQSGGILAVEKQNAEIYDPSTGLITATQLSRRVDSRTVEILRECASGAQIRLVRRAVQPGVLILEITEQQMGGRRSERRLFMEKR
jgi:hypothetical protein